MMGASTKDRRADKAAGTPAFGNRVGMMIGHMPAFMLDFALSGGGFLRINFLSKAERKPPQRWLAKKTVDKMAKQGLQDIREGQRRAQKGLAVCHQTDYQGSEQPLMTCFSVLR